MRKVLRQKRGISPLIATIILIAICVAGGALIYSIFFSTTSTLNATGQIGIQSMSLVQDTDGNTVFAMTIKNVGNKPFTDISVTFATQDEDPLTLPSHLQPGQSTSYLLSAADLEGANYSIGNSYNVIITAHTADGSKLTQTTSVTCTTS